MNDDRPGVIAHPPFLYLGFLAVGLALHALRPMPLATGGAALLVRTLGAVFIFSGAAILIAGRRAMIAAGTNVNPKLPSTKLVVSGPFRRARNPLYLGLTIVYSGIAALSNALAPLALLVLLLPIVHFGVVLREERYLEAKFGEAYRRYKEVTRRWI